MYVHILIVMISVLFKQLVMRLSLDFFFSSYYFFFEIIILARNVYSLIKEI